MEVSDPSHIEATALSAALGSNQTNILTFHGMTDTGNPKTRSPRKDQATSRAIQRTTSNSRNRQVGLHQGGPTKNARNRRFSIHPS
jgi:hypothetical protein